MLDLGEDFGADLFVGHVATRIGQRLSHAAFGSFGAAIRSVRRVAARPSGLVAG